MSHRARRIFSLLFAATVLARTADLGAQVTTATLYGLVSDSTGAVLPGASITATHQGTGVSRDAVTSERGEFALPALPGGPYTLKIEMPGFKTYTSQGLQLGAGQTVRQTYALEVGQLSENITIAETAPLVETAFSGQIESLGTLEARELPLPRRNVQGLLGLSAGADSGAILRGVRLNGVGAGGTGITVDGTEANSNPEGRALAQYGGQNQIDVISIEAVEEVQVVKGVLPAEYGGVVGGQVNMISRSGTNKFHGSLFENYQGEEFLARDPFLLATTPKPAVKFNQFGGSLGGPVVRSRAFFFTTYEGYRETAGMRVLGTVPTQALRDQILAALPFPETRIALDPLPLPNEPLTADVGRYVAVKNRERRDNHVVAKGDLALRSGGNLSVTYSRMRPFTVTPSVAIDGANDRTFNNEQDRIAAQFVLSRSQWVSESRFGWNRTFLLRLDAFLDIKDPNKPERVVYDRRVPLLNLTGLFTTPSSESWDMTGHAYNFDQKLSRVVGTHNVKVGFRWTRQGGGRLNPQNPEFRYQNKADLLANRPNAVIPSFGAPPYNAHLDEYGGFIQDDWRVNKRLVLNLGLRYDSYSVIQVKPTSDLPAQIVNVNPPNTFTLQKMDFGAIRPPDKPYEPDRVNFGPRAGLAWTVDATGHTVVRGGIGFLFSPHLPATVWQSAAHPSVPFRVNWSRTEAADRNLKWPMYTEDLRAVLLKDTGGTPSFFSVFDTHLPNPYTIQTVISMQRELGPALMAEVGYVRTDGRNFPLQRPLPQAFDRQTGARPQGWNLGSPGGFYVDSGQTMDYNGLQASLRKRLSNDFQFDFHYTLSKGTSTQGGDIQSYTYLRDNFSAVIYTQDFFNPEAEVDRGPSLGDARHRFAGDVIYEIPWLKDGNGILHHILGGWQLASIFSARSGGAMVITQPSGMLYSRPDYVGGDPVRQDWRSTLSYLNTAAFALVPTSPVTTATLRPGTVRLDQVRGPAAWTVDLSLAKNFRLTESMRLQVRVDAFNALNHVNFNNPNPSILSPEFGRITTSASPRAAQIGARLAF
ncbi:MAG TPA: TonB-dependent receptor [Terriglobia bacterium]|nr:TonB-dependent receptor [Terriglobia bacterium]